MGTVMILNPPVRWWRCPSCQTTDRTERSDIHTQMHNCPGLLGIVVPLVEVATLDTEPDAQHVLVEREDYIGFEHADHIMAVRTEHGDGSNDCTVFAPTAHVKIEL